MVPVFLLHSVLSILSVIPANFFFILISTKCRLSGSQERREAAGEEEGWESCESAFWEKAKAVRHWRSSSAEEGFASVREMAPSCENPEEEDDTEAKVEGSTTGSSVHQNLG